MDPKRSRKWTQNGAQNGPKMEPKIDPKWIQNGAQNETKMDPKFSLKLTQNGPQGIDFEHVTAPTQKLSKMNFGRLILSIFLPQHTKWTLGGRFEHFPAQAQKLSKMDSQIIDFGNLGGLV